MVVEAVVDERMLAAGGTPVLRTAALVELCERAGRGLVAPLLERGEEAVGVEIHLVHHAAAARGSTVRCVADEARIDGRRVSLSLRTEGPAGLLAEGRLVLALTSAAAGLDLGEG